MIILPVPRSPFPVPHSLFPIPHSPFPIPPSLPPFVSLVIALTLIPTPLAAQTLPAELAKPVAKADPSSLFKPPREDPPLFSQAPDPPLFQPIHRPPIQRQPFQPQVLPLLSPTATAPSPLSPSITMIIPSAYGASQGEFAAGLGLQMPARFTNRSDGVYGFKLGLGDSETSLGLEFGLALVDLAEPWRGDGSLSVKVHRTLSPHFNVAVGVQSFAQFGNVDSAASVYGVATQRLDLHTDLTQPLSQLHLTLGVGNGQFRSEAAVQENRSTVGIFGAAALRLTPNSSAIAEWTGQDLSLGASWVPLADLPFVVVLGVSDLTGSAGDRARLIFSASYNFSF
ncbi:hypothetical protein VB712_04915 [Spirulina sp. CCNP1310]|uniref:hypothetical protein n=1 Tax=Spirulina sp. CCNP1310 TaxID=3110249 RepID=UPI002B2081D0|nr:hypothetical protein [Spirulina sp. CCNP1310]MEA5418558.1 hypothetical protein [Spirulina sp. CCNP1310]